MSKVFIEVVANPEILLETPYTAYFPMAKVYKMYMEGFLLFSVTDSEGACNTFNAQQIQRWFSPVKTIIHEHKQ